MKIILGSSSSSRRKILNNSGVVFITKKPSLNESIEKRKFKGSKKELPIYLAEKKALSINSKKQDLVIGADQILLFKGRVYDKPKSLAEAKKHLLEFSGKTHHLISGTVIARNKTIIWRHLSLAKMKMHQLTKKTVDDYLALSGKKILKSVGAYNIEGYGVKLFNKIDGDYYSIVGLPIIPLLNKIKKLEKK
tara:strand:+ start:714 stop:1289 length:576 start_codon:yes stop_codon:yes gene_type:complete